MALSSAWAYTERVAVHGATAGGQRQALRRRGAQLQDPFVGRVVGLAVADRAHPRVGGDRRRGEVRLPGTQVDHVLARRLAALRLLGDGDGRGGLEVVQVRGQAERRALGHGRMTPKRFRTASVESSGSARTVPRYPRTVPARNREL